MKFKLFSINITIAYSLLCFAACTVALNMFSGFMFCFAAVLAHEAGHITAMCLLKSNPDSIKISLFEIRISDKHRHNRKYKENFLIIFFGPFANFICFISFYLLYLVSNGPFLEFALANLSVGVFNLLPVITLDGGQLIYLILSKRFTNGAAEKAVNILTFIFIFPLALLGFLVLFYSKYNFSLLLICIYLIFSLVCKDNRYF